MRRSKRSSFGATEALGVCLRSWDSSTNGKVAGREMACHVENRNRRLVDGHSSLQMKMRCETRTVPVAGMWREKNLDEAGADQNPGVLRFFPTTTSTAEMISCAASERSMVGGFVARGAMLE